VFPTVTVNNAINDMALKMLLKQRDDENLARFKQMVQDGQVD
jgi:hypothetical protein